MAILKIPYPGLNESLKYLRLQVIESLPYCLKHCPRFQTPEEIFNYAKSKYQYKNDPPAIEFFQTVPTLLTDNDHFKAGEGDCDDATIFILSLLLVNGFPAGIVLAGRNKYRPTHIYAYTDWNGQRYNLDLTNKNFNQIRYYKFKQYIPFNLTKKEKNMYLQLADGRPSTVRILTEKEKKKSVYFPSKNVFIPAERFDNLPGKKVTETLLAEGYEPEQINEFLSGRAERKAERKEFKKEKRTQRIEKKKAKTDIKKARAEKKRATGEARRTRAEAKRIKAESGEEPKFKRFIKTAGEVVKPFIQPQEEFEQEEFYPQEVEQEEFEQEEEPTEMSEGNFTKKEIFSGIAFIAGFFIERQKLLR